MKCEVRLIIGPRDREIFRSERSDAPVFSRPRPADPGDNCLGFRIGLLCIPRARGDGKGSLWFGRRQSLLRGAAKEREDTVHLRSASTGELCERLVSSCWHAAVLVFEEAS